jgi:hypothetical protein
MEKRPCQKKPQNIIRRHQNITLTPRGIMAEPPNTMKLDNTKRQHTTRTLLGLMQFTPEGILKRQ